MSVYRQKLSDPGRTRVYSDNDDIVKRPDANCEPIRAATWADSKRERLIKANDAHVQALQDLFERFEREHRFPAGMGAQMLLNTGMGRL